VAKPLSHFHNGVGASTAGATIFLPRELHFNSHREVHFEQVRYLNQIPSLYFLVHRLCYGSPGALAGYPPNDTTVVALGPPHLHRWCNGSVEESVELGVGGLLQLLLLQLPHLLLVLLLQLLPVLLLLLEQL
jgi:hypothetical protein